jgi:hypothetical protein
LITDGTSMAFFLVALSFKGAVLFKSQHADPNIQPSVMELIIAPGKIRTRL